MGAASSVRVHPQQDGPAGPVRRESRRRSRTHSILHNTSLHKKASITPFHKMSILAPRDPSAQESSEMDLPSGARKYIKPIPRLGLAEKRRPGEVLEVCVFISSTFRDMHGERDLITREVFPEINEWAASRKVRLIPVDLRWGLTAEENGDAAHNVLQLCLDEVERCRGWFLALSGERYGWVPKEYSLGNDALYDWISVLPRGEYVLPPSITVLETMFACLNEPDRPTHAFAYFRSPEFVDSIPDEALASQWVRRPDGSETVQRIAARSVFRDPDEDKYRPAIEELRAQLIFHPFCQVTDGYKCQYVPEELSPDGAAKVGGLDELKAIMLNDLRGAIEAEFPVVDVGDGALHSLGAAIREPALVREFLSHFDFAHEHTRTFLGRTIAYDMLMRYARQKKKRRLVADVKTRADGKEESPFVLGMSDTDASADVAHDRPVLITGHSGYGKSALMARLALELIADSKYKCLVVPVFCGHTSASSDPLQLVNYMARVIRAHFNKKMSESSAQAQHTIATAARDFIGLLEEIGSDDILRQMASRLTGKGVNGLARLFRRKMKGKSTVRLVLVIDGLNQMVTSRYHPGEVLAWIPERLPPGIRVIVSCAPGVLSDSLAVRKNPPSLAPVGALKPSEQSQLVKLRFERYHKRLEPAQLRTLLAKSSAGSPLYLTIACEEIRMFGVYEKFDAFIESLPGDIDGIFRQAFARIEHDAGKLLASQIEAALCLIAASRHGLTEEELLELLSPSASLHASYGGVSIASPPPRSLSVEDERTAYTPMRRATAAVDHKLQRKVWASVYHSIRAYIRPPAAGGAGRIEFFHRQVKKAVRRRYMCACELDCRQFRDGQYCRHVNPSAAGKNRADADGVSPQLASQWVMRDAAAHARLASLFAAQGDPSGAGLWDGESATGVSEVLYHATHALDWTFVHSIACNLNYIAARIRHNLGPSLLAEYDMCVSAGNAHDWGGDAEVGLAVNQFARFCRRWIHRMAADPSSLRHLARQCPDDSAVYRAVIGLSGVSGASGVEHLLSDGGSGDSKGKTGSLKWINKPQKENPLLQTFTGHTNRVTCMALDASGNRLLSGDGDYTARVWDFVSGVCISTLTGHLATITWCALLKIGCPITGSRDGTFRVWRADSAVAVVVVDAHTRGDTCFDLSSDERRLVSGGMDGRLCVHMLPMGRLLAEVYVTDAVFTSVVWTDADGTTVAAGTSLGDVHVWDVKTDGGAQVCRRIEWDGCGKGEVTCMRVSADFRWLSACTSRVGVFDIASGCVAWQPLEGHAGKTSDCAFSPDGLRMVTCGVDGIVRLHTAAPPIVKPAREEGTVDDCSDDRSCSDDRIGCSVDEALVSLGMAMEERDVSRDGEEVASLPARFAWSVVTIVAMKQHVNGVTCCVFSPDGSVFATGGFDRSVRLWHGTTGRPIAVYLGHFARVTNLAFAPTDSSRLVSSSIDETVRLWNADVVPGFESTGTTKGDRTTTEAVWGTDGNTPSRINSIAKRGVRESVDVRPEASHGHLGAVLYCGLLPGGARAVTTGKDFCIKLWCLFTGAEIATLNGHSNWVTCVGASADGTLLASTSFDNTAVLWDAHTNARIVELKDLRAYVYGAVFSPPRDARAASQWLVTWGDEPSIHLYDVEASVGTHEPWSRALCGHTQPVRRCAFSPDGSILASIARAEGARLWNVVTGTCLAVLGTLAVPVQSFSFCPSGNVIVTASKDDVLRVWRVGGDGRWGSAILHVLPGSAAITGIHFSKDGTALVAAYVAQDGSRALAVVDTASLSASFVSSQSHMHGRRGSSVPPLCSIPLTSPAIACGVDVTSNRAVIADEDGAMHVLRLPDTRSSRVSSARLHTASVKDEQPVSRLSVLSVDVVSSLLHASASDHASKVTPHVTGEFDRCAVFYNLWQIDCVASGMRSDGAPVIVAGDVVGSVLIFQVEDPLPVSASP